MDNDPSALFVLLFIFMIYFFKFRVTQNHQTCTCRNVNAVRKIPLLFSEYTSPTSQMIVVYGKLCNSVT